MSLFEMRIPDTTAVLKQQADEDLIARLHERIRELETESAHPSGAVTAAMVERAAEALCDGMAKEDSKFISWKICDFGAKDSWRATARVVLTAALHGATT